MTMNFNLADGKLRFVSGEKSGTIVVNDGVRRYNLDIVLFQQILEMYKTKKHHCVRDLYKYELTPPNSHG